MPFKLQELFYHYAIWISKILYFVIPAILEALFADDMDLIRV